MNKLKDALVGIVAWFVNSGSFRRLLAFLVGIACTALASKLGLSISAETQAMIVALVISYLGQSVLKDILKKAPPQVPELPTPPVEVEAAKAALAELKK